MILQITEGMSHLGLLLRNPAGQQLVSWQTLELHITPGQHGACWEGGSPWFLYGCWPGHSTGVDTANPRHDFPAIILPATGLSEDGLVTFDITPQVWGLPQGRYTGQIVHAPWRQPIDCNRLPPRAQKRFFFTKAKPFKNAIPKEYRFPECRIEFPEPPHKPAPHKVCVLATFDIDKGPMCAQHMVERVDVELLTPCVGEN